MNSTLNNLLFGGTRMPTLAAEIGTTALRVFAGLSLALAHGIGKFPPSQKFIQSVESLGFPQPPVFAWAAAISELVGGILLAAGLVTRVSAALIVGTMTTAAFLQHARDPYRVKELALAYFFIGVMFMLKGAGRFSVDSYLRKGK